MEEILGRDSGLLGDIKRSIEKAVNWKELPLGVGGAHGYQSVGGAWHIVTCAFSIESQGFPEDSLGYDGAASGSGMIVRLTRELAEFAYMKAKEALKCDNGS